MKNLIKVYLVDGSAKITGYRKISDNEIFDETRFRQVDDAIYDYVVANYEKGDLTFADHIVDLTLEDIQFAAFDQVSAMVNNALNVYIYTELRDDNEAFDMFLMSVKFTILNNQMLAAGFFFTASNKEEVYLNVLNSGDATLIAILEDYIEVFDALSMYNTKVNNYIQMKTALTSVSTVQEVIDTYASYTARNLIDDMNR